MTDKQIIVDVTKCKYSTFDGGCTMLKTCANNPNCYYKQLKRKEQECEELKNIINEAQNSKLDLKSFLVGEAIQNEYEQQLDQLKAENRELKAVHSTNVALSDELFKYKAENEKLKKASCKFKDYCTCDTEKFKQTLTEIKEIAKPFCEECKEFGSLHKERDCMYCNYGKILQKISECEGTNE